MATRCSSTPTTWRRATRPRCARLIRRSGFGPSARCMRRSLTLTCSRGRRSSWGSGGSRTTDRRPPTKRGLRAARADLVRSLGRKMEADTSGGLARYRCRLSGGDYARNEALDGSHPAECGGGRGGGSRGRSTATWPRCATRPGGGDDPGADPGRHRAGPPGAGERRTGPSLGAGRRHEAGRYRAALDAGADPAVIGGWIVGRASRPGGGGTRRARRHPGGADG